MVLIEGGKPSSDPTVVTVNCPDKAGLRSGVRSASMLAVELRMNEL